MRCLVTLERVHVDRTVEYPAIVLRLEHAPVRRYHGQSAAVEPVAWVMDFLSRQVYVVSAGALLLRPTAQEWRRAVRNAARRRDRARRRR